MKKRHVVIILVIIAVITWLFAQLLSDMHAMNTEITALQMQVKRVESGLVSIRQHDVMQDKLLGEAVMAVHKPAPPVRPEVKAPTVELPPIVPIPFYVGAMEALKQWIFR